MEASTSGPIKLGVITDQTGPLSFMGIANANVARQHHVRMNMYIAQARGGRFEVVESLGVIDPKEALVSIG